MNVRVGSLLVSMLAIILAGCVTPPTADDVTPASDDSALTAAPGLDAIAYTASGAAATASDRIAATGGSYHLGYRATEPTIAADSTGAVYMTAFLPANAAGRSAPTIVKTSDQGQTIEIVGPRLPSGDGVPPATNDPYVYVDPSTDRVFMLDLIGTACSVLSYSDDGGATWTTNPFACGTPGGNDHQTMIAAKSRGTVAPIAYENVVYYCVNRVVDTACATSLDGGLTFTPLRPVFCCGQGGLTGHLAAAPDGTVYLARPWQGGIAVALTEDDGLNWEIITIQDDVRTQGHDIELAVDEEGNVYALWTRLDDGLLYLAHSSDAGRTWSAPARITPPGITATTFGAIAAGAAGKVAIAYVGSTIPGGYEGKDTGIGGLAGDLLGEPEPEEWAEATWNGYLAFLTDARAADPIIHTASVNPLDDPLARGLCGRTRCGGMNDFLAVTIDADGRAWGAYVDVCTATCASEGEVIKDGAEGLLGTFYTGPSLSADGGDLARLVARPE